MQLLAEYGLSFDICINHRQLAEHDRAGAAVPGRVSFILDHIGKPDIKEHVLDPWREQIARAGRAART